VPYIKCADIIIYSISTALVFHVVSIINDFYIFLLIFTYDNIDHDLLSSNSRDMNIIPLFFMVMQ